MSDKVSRYVLNNPFRSIHEEMRPLPNTYTVDQSKWWQKLVIKAMMRVGIIKGAAVYMHRDVNVEYQRIEIDVKDLNNALDKHLTRIIDVHGNGGVDRIVIGRNVYAQWTHNEFTNPISFVREMAMSRHSGAYSIRGGLHAFQYRFDVKVQLVPWFDGILVVPKDTD